jgi:hypothetical protein
MDAKRITNLGGTTLTHDLGKARLLEVLQFFFVFTVVRSTRTLLSFHSAVEHLQVQKKRNMICFFLNIKKNAFCKNNIGTEAAEMIYKQYAIKPNAPGENNCGLFFLAER